MDAYPHDDPGGTLRMDRACSPDRDRFDLSRWGLSDACGSLNDPGGTGSHALDDGDLDRASVPWTRFGIDHDPPASFGGSAHAGP